MAVRKLLAVVCALACQAAALATDIDRIALLGCLKQNQPTQALAKCLASKPDLCLWIGDNVYADTDRTAHDMPHLLFHVVDAESSRDEVTYRVNFTELERRLADPDEPLRSDAAAVGARALGPGRPVPTHAGHAHNDYWHERPLLDALERGFCSVEADVFLRGGDLLVGHAAHELRPERTIDALAADTRRLAGVDGRLEDLDRDDRPATLVPLVSDRWGKRFSWYGDGPMPADERAELRELVARAHARGQAVRFWATPDAATFWNELTAAGVDLIGCDDLDAFADFAAGSEKPGTPD